MHSGIRSKQTNMINETKGRMRWVGRKGVRGVQVMWDTQQGHDGKQTAPWYPE